MVAEMMQYKDFVHTHADPILAQSDETVQNAVYDWFKYRYIGFSDQEKFLDILKRNVAINYPIYRQKLRIEPGVSQYDWLVQTYRERQLKTKGESNAETTYNSNNTLTKTGTDTVTRSGSQDNVKTGSDTSVKSGGHTTKDVEGLRTQTSSPHVQRITKTDNDHNGWNGNSHIESNLPMSKSYDKMIEPSDDDTSKQYYKKAYQHMPSGFDWTTASAQSQDGHREYAVEDNKVTESYVYDDGVKGDIVTTEGDKAKPSESELTYQNETDTHTYNSVKDETTYNDVKDEHKYNTVDDAAHRGEDTTHGDDTRTDRERVTGRSEAPADILARATMWIENSSAFKWFKEQIDPCFAPWYGEEGGLI